MMVRVSLCVAGRWSDRGDDARTEQRLAQQHDPQQREVLHTCWWGGEYVLIDW